MPFPLVSHQGLAAPGLLVGRGRRLDAVAYLSGTLAPDLAYALDRTRLDFDAHSHTLVGVVLWSVPVAVVSAWLFRRFVAHTLAAHLPDAGPLRLRDVAWAAADHPALWVAALSALLGALTHVAFDGFTHPEPWAVDRLPVLDDSAPLSLPTPGRPTRWYDVVAVAANYGGVALAAATLYWSGLRRARAGRARPELPPVTARSRLALAGSLVAGSVVGALAAAVVWGPETMAQATMLFTCSLAAAAAGGCALARRYPAVPMSTMEISLNGWDIGSFEDLEWVPWGSDGKARAKVLASGDGYTLALVEAEPGYAGTPHEHSYAEFLYVVDGTLRNQGREMRKGDGYVAAAGSTHADFTTEDGATYISIFKL